MNNKKNPFFSIVIPTRNRADTLEYTIKTILNQDFNDYEIIICNNNSTDNTEEVIQKYSDERVIYIKSSEDLTMCENWELAYTKVSGEYVTYIADNDGFLKGSLFFLQQLLILNNLPNILQWKKNIYNWPSFDSINRNMLLINLKRNFELLESHKIITDVINGKKGYSELPMIYNSMIKNELIKKLITKTGRIFHAYAPDVVTGFSFAILEKQYLSLSYGITSAGSSAKSNGHNALKKKNEILEDFKKSCLKSVIIFHQNIPFVMSLTAGVTESFLKMQELLDYNDCIINYREVYKRILAEVIINDELELEEVRNKVIVASKFDLEFHEWVKKYLIENPLMIRLHHEEKNMIGNNSQHEVLILNACAFNVFDIYSACQFMSNFYSYSLKNISFPLISNLSVDLIGKNSTISIWGNGQLSRKLQYNIALERNDLKIRYIIDSFVENKLSSPPICMPKNFDYYDVDYLIIASTFLDEISNLILQYELHQKIKIFVYEN